MRNNTAGMTLIVKTVTRLTVGLILIYGIYIVLQGHTGPGGGFAGGVIIALSFIHLMLAFGKEEVINTLNQKRSIRLASLGALMALGIVGSGFVFGHRLFSEKASFALFGAGLAPFYDVAVALMVGAGLFSIFLALVLFIGEKKRR